MKNEFQVFCSLGADVVRKDGAGGAVEVADGHLERHRGLVFEGLLRLLHDAVVYPFVDAVVLLPPGTPHPVQRATTKITPKEEKK